MESPVILILTGGLISLVATSVSIILRHILEMRKLVTQTRQYPFRVVYDKQTDFFEALASILLEMNGYITTIDVWLGETSSDAQAKVQDATENNSCLTKFDDLIHQYYMYLPQKLLEKANHLHSECLFLSNNADIDKTFSCINLLFSFQNSIRAFVGIDKLSQDFLKAFSIRTVKGKKYKADTKE